MSVTIKMNSTEAILSERGLDKNGRAQKYIDSEVLRRSSPYLPFDTGMLEKSGISGTIIGSGEVVWTARYARRLYYGTSLNFQKNRPLSGAKWFERMKTAQRRHILQGVASISGGVSID